MHSIVHSAGVQDRDGGVLLMASLFGMFPFPAEALRRQRLHGSEVQDRIERGLPAGQCRDRQAFGHGQVRRAAQAMDRRTHYRLAEPLPATGQGLGVPQHEWAGFPALGINQADGP